MAKGKRDLSEVGIGVALIALTWLDIVPGDEIVGTPLGVALIADGMRWL